MRNVTKAVGLGIAIVLVVGGVACKPKPAKTAETVKPTPTPAAAATPVPVTQDDFKPAKAEPVDTTLDAPLVKLSGYLKDSFFDFDKFDIRADQRDALAANAEWLKKYPTIKIKVEGHCDERGTAQYNMALGEKRASAVKDYLSSLGVDGGRIEIVSYGKERPFVTGSDESAWSQNRRGHFVVTAK
jgi:peptidoglycan-associated lipoprotein